MSDWKPVDGYLALKMMEASAQLAQLNMMFEKMRMDVCLDKPGSKFAIYGVRRQCQKLLGELKTMEYAAESSERRNAETP